MSKQEKNHILSADQTKNRHVERNHKDVCVDKKHGFYDFIVSMDNIEAIELMSAIELISSIEQSPSTSTQTVPQESSSDKDVRKRMLFLSSKERRHDGDSVSRTTVQSKLLSDTQATLSVSNCLMDCLFPIA